jgi:hypothetical protein
MEIVKVVEVDLFTLFTIQIRSEFRFGAGNESYPGRSIVKETKIEEQTESEQGNPR